MSRRIKSTGWIICTFIGVLVVMGCATSVRDVQGIDSEPSAALAHTHLDDAVTDFGRMVRSYPERRPYSLLDDIHVEVGQILNKSGDESLAWDLSDTVISIVSNVGFPISPKRRLSLEDAQTRLYRQQPVNGEIAELMIEGAITGAEKLRSNEVVAELDLFFEQGNDGRDSIDAGGSREWGEEVWKLTLELRLVDPADSVLAAKSFKTLVVRIGRSNNYGIFVRGSGVGFRSRGLESQSKNQALRILAQMGVITLLGRHLDVPYWRVLPSGARDAGLVTDYGYRLTMREYRRLLYAHGVNLDLGSGSMSDHDERAAHLLAERMGRPSGESSVDFAIHLWETVPYKGEDTPLAALRRRHRFKGLPPSLSDELSTLNPGEGYLLTVFFDFEKATLSQQASAEVRTLIEALRRSELFGRDWWMMIRGHSDERGSVSRNQRLSEDRARAVRDHFSSVFSIPHERMRTSGHGSEKPSYSDASTEEQHSMNRRVEVVVVRGAIPDSIEVNDNLASRTQSPRPVDPFPADRWPLPRGIDLPGELAAVSLAEVRQAYPEGRLSANFGAYAVLLSPEESNFFYEVIFFFEGAGEDPQFSQLIFRCRPGAEDLLRVVLAQRYPDSQQEVFGQQVVGGDAANGYEVTVGSGPSCLRIRRST